MVVPVNGLNKQLLFVPIQKDGSFQEELFFYDTARIYYSFNNDKKLTESAKVEFDNGLLKSSLPSCT